MFALLSLDDPLVKELSSKVIGDPKLGFYSSRYHPVYGQFEPGIVPAI